MLVRMEVELYDGREIEAFGQFVTFLDKKREESGRSEEDIPSVPELQQPAMEPAMEPAITPAVEPQTPVMVDATASTQPATQADVITAIRGVKPDKIPLVLALYKEFKVARATEITAEQAPTFLARFCEVMA